MKRNDQKLRDAQAQHDAGRSHESAGRYEAAQVSYLKALAAFEAFPKTHWDSIALVLVDLGDVAQALGDLCRSEEMYLNGLELLRMHGKGRSVQYARGSTSLAKLYQVMERFDDCIAILKETLSIYDTDGSADRTDRLNSLNSLAQLSLDIDDFRSAFEYIEAAFSLASGTDLAQTEFYVYTLRTASNIHFKVGNYSKSKGYSLQELKLLHTLRDQLEISRVQVNIANCDMHLGDFESAIASAARAQEIRSRFFRSDSREFIPCLLVLGNCFLALKMYDEALSYYNRILPIASRENNLGSLINANINIAICLSGKGSTEEAYSLHLSNVTLAAQRGTSSLVAKVHVNLRQFLAEQGNKAAAVFHGKIAVNAIQKLRKNVNAFSREERASLDRVVETNYVALTELLLSLDRIAEAERVAALLKENEYFEFVRNAGSATGLLSGGISYTDQETPHIEQYEAATGRLADICREIESLRRRSALTDEEDGRLDELHEFLRKASVAFNASLEKITRELGSKAAQASNADETTSGLMSTLRKLTPGTVGIYSILAEDALHLILVTPKYRKSFTRLVSRQELNKQIMEFRQHILERSPGYLLVAQDLFRVIMGDDLVRELEELKTKTILWSLDGALRYLPLSALHDGERFLGERYGASVLTLASHFSLNDPPQDRERGLGLGITRQHGEFQALPHVADELSGIIRIGGASHGIFEGVTHLDEEFTLETMRRELRKHPAILHIASHFHLVPGNDSMSFLLLGNGQKLTLREIDLYDNLFEDVDLITLSACETGVGAARANGGEVDGLGIVAQRKGAKSVMATLWPVADVTTSLLMQEFYRLRADGKAKPEALRLAQCALRSGCLLQDKIDFDEDPGHPFFWAPFFLIGNVT